MDAVAHSRESLATEPSSLKSLKDHASKVISTTRTDSDTDTKMTKTIINAEAPNHHQDSLPSAKIANESRTRWAWRRAEFLGSRLGKVK